MCFVLISLSIYIFLFTNALFIWRKYFFTTCSNKRAAFALQMEILQYSTEYTELLDETSNDTSAYGLNNSNSDDAENGKETMVKVQRQISGPSGLLG